MIMYVIPTCSTLVGCLSIYSLGVWCPITHIGEQPWYVPQLQQPQLITAQDSQEKRYLKLRSQYFRVNFLISSILEIKSVEIKVLGASIRMF